MTGTVQRWMEQGTKNRERKDQKVKATGTVTTLAGPSLQSGTYSSREAGEDQKENRSRTKENKKSAKKLRHAVFPCGPPPQY